MGDAQRKPRVVAFVDQNVADAWPRLTRQLVEYGQAHCERFTLVEPVHLVAAGEACKNDTRCLEEVCRAIHDARIDRQSYVLAVGGGAVLDVVGFAAAIVHRGVRLVRMPTTTLAQADSGVGVKNGINAFGKKNYLGTFAPPWAVINDAQLLTTLPDGEWRDGFAEAVKVALIKDAALFGQIEADAARIKARDLAAALPVIRRSALLHVDHITQGGDPFELTAARPLDFGHWAAHRLEEMTSFTLRHGEAVAIGMMLDCTYATRMGLASATLPGRVAAVLGELGLPTWHDALRDSDRLLEGIEAFREHLGGQLTVTLACEMGRSVDVHAIDDGAMVRAVEELAQTQQRLSRKRLPDHD